MKKTGFLLILMGFIDYGQLAREKEWAACQKVFAESKLPSPIKVDLNGYGKIMPTGITDLSKQIHDQAFLPGRNLLFLVVASSYANYKDCFQRSITYFLTKRVDSS